MHKTKSAFYYFMQDFREDQQRKGIRYENMSEVAELCDPLWQNATPEVRREYREKANMDKERKKNPELIFTSIGVSLAELQRQEKKYIDAEIAERQEVKNLVKQLKLKGGIIDEDFFFIDVNYFCQHISNYYIIGESTVLQLSLKDGFKKKYHEIIHPGKIPIGYQSDVKLGAKDIGLDMPDERVPGSDYRLILIKLTNFLKQNNSELAIIPPLFTMPDKVIPVRSFIQQMCFKAGVDFKKFRVYRLDTLLHRLGNAVKSEFDAGFRKEYVALAKFRKELIMFSPGTACKVHEEADRSLVCSEARLKCWAYSFLDSCCPLAGVRMWPNSHMPPDPDLGVLEIPAYPPGLREQLLRDELMSPDTSFEDKSAVASNNTYIAINTWSANKKSNTVLSFSSGSEDGAYAESTSTSTSMSTAPPPPPQFTEKASPKYRGRDAECASTSTSTTPPPPPQFTEGAASPKYRGRGYWWRQISATRERSYNTHTWRIKNSNSVLSFSSGSEDEAYVGCSSTSTAPPPSPQFTERVSPIYRGRDAECASTSTSTAPPPPPQFTEGAASPIYRGRGRHLLNLLAKVDLKK